MSDLPIYDAAIITDEISKLRDDFTKLLEGGKHHLDATQKLYDLVMVLSDRVKQLENDLELVDNAVTQVGYDVIDLSRASSCDGVYES